MAWSVELHDGPHLSQNFVVLSDTHYEGHLLKPPSSGMIVCCCSSFHEVKMISSYLICLVLLAPEMTVALYCAGPIEAASNAETSTTQLVQDITIRAQVWALTCMKKLCITKAT